MIPDEGETSWWVWFLVEVLPYILTGVILSELGRML